MWVQHRLLSCAVATQQSCKISGTENTVFSPNNVLKTRKISKGFLSYTFLFSLKLKFIPNSHHTSGIKHGINLTHNIP